MHVKLSPEDVKTVACIGAGVIGGGWVAHFLARGYDVHMWDPAPDAEAKVRHRVEAVWPVLTELGLAPGADPGRLVAARTLDSAVADADFIQESGPEALPTKIDLLAHIDSASSPDVVVASSTAGHPMTDMQVGATRPERFVVGHPFNPPYLLPLVEVVGGRSTSAAAVAWASAFYTAAGKSVITMDSEVPGFIANRLQEALWREALHMVAAGEATIEQIDRAVTDGPGLRWAFHGPFTTFHLAGGHGGIAHALEHFDPTEYSQWSRLASPELSKTLKQHLIDGAIATTDGRDVAELTSERDASIAAILRTLRRAEQPS